jgi:hypothetical protein
VGRMSCGVGNRTCAICWTADGCLASRYDDYFIPAKEEQLIERLNNNKYPRYRDLMIETLLNNYNYDYIHNCGVESAFIVKCKNCKWKPSYDPPDEKISLNLVFPDSRCNPCPFKCEDNWFSEMPEDDFFCKYGEK